MRRQRIPRLALWARLLLVLVLLGLAPALRASCYGGGYHRVVPLGWGDYSIGEDAPIGTVFYRQLVHGDLPYSISCNADSVHSGRMQVNFRVDEKNWSATGGADDWSPVTEIEFIGDMHLMIHAGTCQVANDRYTYTFPKQLGADFPALGATSEWLAAPVTLH
ncbi:hypothetical protein NMD97_09830 [Edwardsiella tarda]